MIYTISSIRVRYAETDRMNVVHHSHYLVWFESARILMLDEIGIPYRKIEERGLYIPVLAAGIDYKRSAYFDDHLQVHLFMYQKPRARFQIHYEVRREEVLIATGTTTHGFMDKLGKGLRPPKDFLDKVNAAWKEVKAKSS